MVGDQHAAGVRPVGNHSSADNIHILKQLRVLRPHLVRYIPVRVHRLGQLIHFIQRQVVCPGDVADGALGGDGIEGDDLRCLNPGETHLVVQQIFLGQLPVCFGVVHVDVGEGYALRVHEAEEVEAVLHGVHVGNTGDVGTHGAGDGSSAVAGGDAVFLFPHVLVILERHVGGGTALFKHGQLLVQTAEQGFPSVPLHGVGVSLRRLIHFIPPELHRVGKDVGIFDGAVDGEGLNLVGEVIGLVDGGQEDSFGQGVLGTVSVDQLVVAHEAQVPVRFVIKPDVLALLKLDPAPGMTLVEGVAVSPGDQRDAVAFGVIPQLLVVLGLFGDQMMLDLQPAAAPVCPHEAEKPLLVFRLTVERAAQTGGGDEDVVRRPLQIVHEDAGDVVEVGGLLALEGTGDQTVQLQKAVVIPGVQDDVVVVAHLFFRVHGDVGFHAVQILHPGLLDRFFFVQPLVDVPVFRKAEGLHAQLRRPGGVLVVPGHRVDVGGAVGQHGMDVIGDVILHDCSCWFVSECLCNGLTGVVKIFSTGQCSS